MNKTYKKMLNKKIKKNDLIDFINDIRADIWQNIDKPNSLKLTILHDNLDELAQELEESEKI